MAWPGGAWLGWAGRGPARQGKGPYGHFNLK